MAEDNKKKYSQWMINFLLSLLLVAYGFIFNSTLHRIDKVETKVEELNPIFTQIQTDLVEIKTNIIWLKNNN